MKKTVLFLAAILLATTSFAQHISEYYTFSESYIGDYTYLYNGDIILENTDSDGGEIPNVAIGFDFEYAGTTYSSLTIGINGAITFTGNDVYGGNELDGTATNTTDIIAPLWDDLYFSSGDDAEIRTDLSGTSPNRSFAIEWRNVNWWGAGSSVTFKLYLNESSNDIEMYYSRVEVEETGGEIGASIGLNTGTSGDNFISVTPGSPATVSTTTANNTIMPSEYTDYVKYNSYTFKYGPHNDACEDAIVINPNGYTNTQIMNGTDNNDGFIAPSGCGDGMNDGVWYTFTPDYDGEIVIDVTADDFDVEVAVYTGGCGSFSCVANADINGTGGTEQVIIDVTMGTQYWVNAGAYYSALDHQETGNLTINVNYNPPANDVCTDATEINCGDVLDGTNIGATGTGLTNCDLNANSTGVWYHFTPTNGGGVTAIWTTADFDTKLVVYSGTCGSLSCLAYDDDTNGNQPYIEIETLPETDYYIYVAGYSSYTGAFSLNVACTTPVNDEATGAILMDVNTIDAGCTNPTTVWNNNGATSSESTNDIPACGNYAGGDLWYKFVAPASGGVRVLRASAGDWDAMAYALYDSASGDNSDIIACATISMNVTEGNPITGLTVGNTYYLRIWEWLNNDFGSVGICLEEVDTIGFEDLVAVGFKYYPNPATDVLYLSAQESINQLNIYNMLGQEVKNNIPLMTNFTLDVSDLKSGTYFIKAQVGNHIGTFKLIKQ